MTTDKMLIDAAHPEETRVVVLRGNRIEEFDYESAAKKLLRGNIYLAKITRVEPSLQAAFVDYGGNRHGFLAFSEIHPDYYQIPVADRQALLREEAEAVAEEARREASEIEPAPAHDGHSHADDAEGNDSGPTEIEEAGGGSVPWDLEDAGPAPVHGEAGGSAHDDAMASERRDPVVHGSLGVSELMQSHEVLAQDGNGALGADHHGEPGGHEHAAHEGEHAGHSHGGEAPAVDEQPVEDTPERKRRPRRASYKIQEVIKRRQIILVQVVKEERGNKGAALTTYLSLAGRYTVLMPNTARGGGISRKITNAVDRRRLKEITSELEVPDGMGLIVRTAGASRNIAEIKRDHDYLLRLWESIRDLTLKSTAPALVYEEGSLVKRSIRDLYSKEIDEVIVAGQDSYESARDFMRMLMPSHAKNVKLYEDAEPLFARYQIERQLNAMYSPYVTLKSGGYIVLNQTEALVAIDVNSGKSTREHNIEDTALNTNLEACDEVARQLRLRDLAGLIVIDFIDMDERRNNRSVENRLKNALRHDRARIQVGRISHFGLMEMSRQRLRTGVLEGSTSQCPHCMGTGVIRSTESVALAVLRALEDNLMGHTPRNMVATTSIEAALYLLNEKRAYLRDIEGRYGVVIEVDADAQLQGSNFRIDASGAATGVVAPARPRSAVQLESGFEDEAEDATLAAGEAPSGADDHIEQVDQAANGEDGEEATGPDGERKRSRRRRRRRGERGDRPEREAQGQNGEASLNGNGGHESEAPAYDSIGDDAHAAEGGADTDGPDGDDEAERTGGEAGGAERSADGERRGRRRGRRGGRRNRRGGREGGEGAGAAGNGGGGEGHIGAEPYPIGAEQPVVQGAPWAEPITNGGHEHHADEHRNGGHRESGRMTEAPAAIELPPPPQQQHVEAASAVGSAFRNVSAPEPAVPAPAAHHAPPPAAAPAMAEAAPEPAGPPKRGWWSKRFSGG